MARVPPAELRDLSLSVAHQVVGEGVDDVDVRLSADTSDKPAYFIAYRFGDRRHRERASSLRTRLSQHLRDELIRRGDARYPFVRLMTAEDWDRRGDAGFG